jgi:hypothetical protein
VRIDSGALNDLAGEAGMNPEYKSAIRDMMNRRRKKN